MAEYMSLEEFAVLYDANFALVKSVAAYILGDDRDSVAVADLTMCYAFCHPDKFRNMACSAATAYLVKIARTRSYDELRTRCCHRYTEISDIEDTPYVISGESIERIVEIKEFKEAVKRHILAMPAIYRDTLTLKIALEMSLPEIAATLGIPIDTTKTRCRRGMALLKGFLVAKGYNSLCL